MFISELLEINDTVLAFDQFMEEIGIEQYLKPEKTWEWGRPRYNRVRMLKTVLYSFMDKGYSSLREIEENCKVNIRYMYLMNYETPSYHTFSNFINEELGESIEAIFLAVMNYIRGKEQVDMEHVYIDGSKFEANAGKYTWVWKKATEKSRYKLFGKITKHLNEMNEELSIQGIRIDTNTEYTPEYLGNIVQRYLHLTHTDESQFKRGKGKRKSAEQRHCEKLREYADKLQKYIVQITTCGLERNSYSKTDPDATFMRMKRDYMGNDQLLPAYNIQLAVADEYIVAVDTQQYRSDMDCFVPLMEKFHAQYGSYPQYPVADAGYGSYNNYLYCREHGMGLYMKFPMYKKETKDKKYRNNPFRAVNFKTDEADNLICPNNKRFLFSYRKPVKGNKYGRQEEIYTCEDCSDCSYAEQCKKGQGNRTISLNEELTQIHQEVLDNLECTHGALLRMNRSIQAEGSFGVLKYDRWYKRIVRKGINSVKLELFLVSIGHNLYKFYNKQMKQLQAA